MLADYIQTHLVLNVKDNFITKLFSACFQLLQVSGQTQIMRVKVKKLRQKAKLEVDWQSAIEIDLKIERDVDQKLDAQKLSDEFDELMQWADKMM